MTSHKCRHCGGDTKGGTFTGPEGHGVVLGQRSLPAAEVCMDC